ncbi:MAG TPA: adenine phosphoribosyltransferase [Lachnospiraceae bacterium]|nr:adenine phosphoribosyltransferase [Lachnospiraceae bacterium]
MKPAIDAYLKTIPDFPRPGVQFRDISPLLADPDGLCLAVDTLEARVKDLSFDVLCGAESRGFVFAAPIARDLHKGLILIRKKGKLPGKTIEVDYDLEYGSAGLELEEGLIKPGQRVLIVDDLLATGGTAKAMCELVTKAGGVPVSLLVLIELEGLSGREKVAPVPVYSAISYRGK